MAQVQATPPPAQQPPPGQSPQPQQVQVQQQVLPQPDAALQALIEQDFKPVSFKLGGPKESRVLCPGHELEKCAECGVDYVYVNSLAKIFVDNPTLACPPPPQIVQQQRSQAVTKMKDEGNILFKKNMHQKAIEMYTMAANVASQRLFWEPNQMMKEEFGNVLSNRAASYQVMGDYIASLVDAELVIQCKRPWSKGYFRKARALLSLGDLEDAKDAVKMALIFEPNNVEMSKFMDEIDSKLAASEKQ